MPFQILRVPFSLKASSGLRLRAPAFGWLTVTLAERLNIQAMRPVRCLVRQTASTAAAKLAPSPRARAPRLILHFRKTGKPTLRTRHREEDYSPETFRMECVLEKPVAPLTRVRHLPENPLSLVRASFSGAGEGIRTPDPLITNQMLYRLSYASNSGESARLRANLSLGSLPDVRDNYINYHSVKIGCNKAWADDGPTLTLRH
jgi:hypothetical protein